MDSTRATPSADLGPLAWCISEIKHSLKLSQEALVKSLDEASRSASLSAARVAVHQANGALNIVGISGVPLLLKESEQQIQMAIDTEQVLSQDQVDCIGRTYQATTEYLSDLLEGRAHQPVVLYPQYKALLELRNADRNHPADLFFPDLSVRLKRPPVVNKPDSDQVANARSTFERALLVHLRDSQQVSALNDMAGSIEMIDRAFSDSDSGTFWAVLSALFAGLRSGSVAADLYTKRVVAKVNLQVRKMLTEQAPASERLQTDALFLLARANNDTPAVALIRKAFRLEGQVPADFDQLLYGVVDANVLEAAKASAQVARQKWEQLCEGQRDEAKNFSDAINNLGQNLIKLPVKGLVSIAQALAVAGQRGHQDQVNNQVAIEVAIAILYLEHVLQIGARLSSVDNARAQTVAQRLNALMGGARISEALPEWLSAVAQRAQERDTLKQFVGEVQANLQAAEAAVDAYFRDPTQTQELAQVADHLQQISGVLMVLGYQPVGQGAKAISEKVRVLATSGEHDSDVNSSVATSIGVLSLFVESLLRSDTLADRCGFNQERGELYFADESTASLGEVVEVDLPALAVPDSTAGFVQQTSVLASQPVQVQLAEPVSAALVEPFETSLAEPVETALVEAPAHPLAEESDIDPEILEIFLLEAQEVLEAVQDNSMVLSAAASNAEAMTNIRRAFHTLKGSGRMVGLNDFGEAGWAMEQTLNLWLGEKRPASASLLLLIETAHELFCAWVAQLAVDVKSPVDPEPLASLCLRLRDGDEITSKDLAGLNLAFASEALSSESVGESIPVDFPSLELPVVESYGDLLAPAAEPVSDQELFALDVAQLNDVLELQPEDALLEDEPPISSESALQTELPSLLADPAIEFDFDLPLETHDGKSALLEAETLAQQPTIFGTPLLDVPAVPEEPISSALEIDNFPDTESLFISDSTSGIEDEVDLFVNETIQTPVEPLDEPVFEPVATAFVPEKIEEPTVFLEQTDTFAPDMGEELRAIFLSESDDLLDAINVQARQWQNDPSERASELVKRAMHSLAGSSAIMGLEQVHAIALHLETFLQLQMSLPRTLIEQETSDVLYVAERLTAALHRYAAGQPQVSEEQAIVKAEALHREWNEHFVASPIPAKPASALSDAQTLAQNFGIASTSALMAAVASATAVSQREAQEAVKPVSLVNQSTDELDADLAPIFVEEALDLLPQVGDCLRQWSAQPSDAQAAKLLMRHLHTIKGSARMAGAMRLGQLVHEMESRVESALVLPTAPAVLLDELQAEYDVALNLFEVIRDPALASSQAHVRQVVMPEQLKLGEETVDIPSFAPASSSSVAPGLASQVAQTLANSNSAEVIPTVQTVRVRADVLDRLVNEAGEVSISRSRVDNQVGSIRGSLTDLTDNVNRLRAQLREIEIHAESQISSQVAATRLEAQFDPLEFDRFTRFQELTRMMAESVNDVATVQQNMLRNLNEVTLDMTRQGQLTRDLQQGLMSVRMVQFSSVSDRLFRVVRLAAKEAEKRVNLDIRGGSVGIDRSVLERIVAPLEHLLRNSVGHGIESREARLAAGKSEVGEIVLQVRQEGNEIVLEISDDGAGLNYEKIRERAIASGLLGADAPVLQTELAQMIFMPGFSTATQLTTLAGRGVGMDIVRAETTALGGRIDIQSQPGKGTQFILSLPASMAITQVVLMAVGDYRFSVPSVLVEQVLQLKPQQLAAAYTNKSIDWQNKKVAFQYMGSLLELPDVTPVAQRYSPIVVLRSSNQQFAVHVDAVLGNQEVVVKNVGPQLARLNGITGATILGDGEIVLIMNPVQLAQANLARSISGADSNGKTVDAEEFDLSFNTSATVMVVDDSLTVRKVTQRLLTREGFQSILAKDGVDGLRQLQDQLPDVILLDVEMPRMDGFDFARVVRSDARLKNIPIIMITSRTADKHRNHALSLGVNVFLGKPYGEAELLSHIRSFIQAKSKVRNSINSVAALV